MTKYIYDVFLRQRGRCLVHHASLTEVVSITSVEKTAHSDGSLTQEEAACGQRGWPSTRPDARECPDPWAERLGLLDATGQGPTGPWTGQLEPAGEPVGVVWCWGGGGLDFNAV